MRLDKKLNTEICHKFRVGNTSVVISAYGNIWKEYDVI